jgi:hypothetical protein
VIVIYFDFDSPKIISEVFMGKVGAVSWLKIYYCIVHPMYNGELDINCKNDDAIFYIREWLKGCNVALNNFPLKASEQRTRFELKITWPFLSLDY